MNDIFISTVIFFIARRRGQDSALRRIEHAWTLFCIVEYYSNDISTVAEMFDEANEVLFHHILANNNHVLQSYLRPRSDSKIVFSFALRQITLAFLA